MALFKTHHCPRLKKDIAFCYEPNQKKYWDKVDCLPIPCFYFWTGQCHYKDRKKKMKNTRPKIIEMKLSDRPAYYDVTNGQIVIDERLRRYPKFRKFIIQHEMGHLKKDKTINDCLRRDMRDYPLMILNNDYWDFQNKYFSEKFDSKKIKTIMQNIYYNFMIIIFVAPISLFIGMIVTIKDIFKKWVKKKQS